MKIEHVRRKLTRLRNEFGRSVIEVLGVLGIMGLLIVGAMWGYNHALAVIMANRIITGVRSRAVVVGQQRVLEQGLDLAEFHPLTQKDLIYDRFEVMPYNNYLCNPPNDPTDADLQEYDRCRNPDAYKDWKVPQFPDNVRTHCGLIGEGIYSAFKDTVQAMEVYDIPYRVCEVLKNTNFPDASCILINGKPHSKALLNPMYDEKIICELDGEEKDKKIEGTQGTFNNVATFVFVGAGAHCQVDEDCPLGYCCVKVEGKEEPSCVPQVSGRCCQTNEECGECRYCDDSTRRCAYSSATTKCEFNTKCCDGKGACVNCAIEPPPSNPASSSSSSNPSPCCDTLGCTSCQYCVEDEGSCYCADNDNCCGGVEYSKENHQGCCGEEIYDTTVYKCCPGNKIVPLGQDCGSSSSSSTNPSISIPPPTSEPSSSTSEPPTSSSEPSSSEPSSSEPSSSEPPPPPPPTSSSEPPSSSSEPSSSTSEPSTSSSEPSSSSSEPSSSSSEELPPPPSTSSSEPSSSSSEPSSSSSEPSSSSSEPPTSSSEPPTSSSEPSSSSSEPSSSSSEPSSSSSEPSSSSSEPSSSSSEPSSSSSEPSSSSSEPSSSSSEPSSSSSEPSSSSSEPSSSSSEPSSSSSEPSSSSSEPSSSSSEPSSSSSEPSSSSSEPSSSSSEPSSSSSEPSSSEPSSSEPSSSEPSSSEPSSSEPPTDIPPPPPTSESSSSSSEPPSSEPSSSEPSSTEPSSSEPPECYPCPTCPNAKEGDECRVGQDSGEYCDIGGSLVCLTVNACLPGGIRQPGVVPCPDTVTDPEDYFATAAEHCCPTKLSQCPPVDCTSSSSSSSSEPSSSSSEPCSLICGPYCVDGEEVTYPGVYKDWLDDCTCADYSDLPGVPCPSSSSSSSEPSSSSSEPSSSSSEPSSSSSEPSSSSSEPSSSSSEPCSLICGPYCVDGEEVTYPGVYKDWLHDCTCADYADLPGVPCPSSSSSEPSSSSSEPCTLECGPYCVDGEEVTYPGVYKEELGDCTCQDYADLPGVPCPSSSSSSSEPCTLECGPYCVDGEEVTYPGVYKEDLGDCTCQDYADLPGVPCPSSSSSSSEPSSSSSEPLCPEGEVWIDE